MYGSLRISSAAHSKCSCLCNRRDMYGSLRISKWLYKLCVLTSSSSAYAQRCKRFATCCNDSSTDVFIDIRLQQCQYFVHLRCLGQVSSRCQKSRTYVGREVIYFSHVRCFYCLGSAN